MFSKSDGATALRADLVRALSFSMEQVKLEGPEGPDPAVAAIASVWNGRKGFVAALVRRARAQIVDRYVYTGPIADAEQLDGALDEGIAFLEGMGFQMDASEFLGLDDAQREKRIGVWNKLRKVRSSPLPEPAAETSQPAPVPPVAEQPTAPEPAPSDTAPVVETPEPQPAPAPAAAQARAEEDAGGRAVLGRIDLVRKGGTKVLGPIARLLSYF